MECPMTSADSLPLGGLSGGQSQSPHRFPREVQTSERCGWGGWCGYLLPPPQIGRTVPAGNREPSPMALLTQDRIQDLAVIVLEECGSCLSDNELTDEIALLLEDIAGFEMASDQVVRQVINQARSHYHDIRKQHAET